MIEVFRFCDMGWLAVWAAFLLLAAGVGLSWLRVRATQTKRLRRAPLSTTRVAGSAPQGVLER